jgi:hypothetical protein
VRHSYCGPFKDGWWRYRWSSLDHPKLLAAPGIDEDVKARARRKSKRAGTVCVDRVDSHRSAGADNVAIYGDGGEWAGYLRTTGVSKLSSIQVLRESL